MSEYVITLNGRKHTVFLNGGSVILDGKEIASISHSKINGNLNLLKINNKTYEVPTIIEGKDNFVFVVNGLKYEITARTKLEETAREVMKNKSGGGKDTEIKAPMPGLILAVKKKEGDKVEPGDPLFILEAMKMENEIRAIKSGRVKKILVENGQSVEKNQLVLIVE
jgi:biotin carboxyl carrier protein